jgi:hypothetical protein
MRSDNGKILTREVTPRQRNVFKVDMDNAEESVFSRIQYP